jgi:hypothetical protein
MVVYLYACISDYFLRKFSKIANFKSSIRSQAWRLTPVILATWEEAIRRVMVPSNPWQKVRDTPSQTVAGHSSTCIPSQQ